MAVVNDAELIELYNASRSELFPALRQRGALTPLVVLLATLPPLIAMVNGGIDSADARWGLQSLELMSPQQAKTSDNGKANDWSFAEQNPLAAVLTGLAVQIPGLSPPIALSLVSLTSMIAVVMFWHSLCRTMAGSRFAFWSTALLACHGPFLIHVQSSFPTMLALALALGTLVGFFSHIDESEGLVSGRLLFAGISLGLCLLASGLAAATVIVIGFLLATATRVDSNRTGANGGGESRSSILGKWKTLRSLFVLASTAFAVGGWWVMMSAAEHRSTFWPIWLEGGSLATSTNSVSDGPSGYSPMAASLFRLVNLMGMLLVPSLIGFACLGRDLWLRHEFPQRRSMQFLASWVIAAFAIWIVGFWRRTGPADISDLLMLLPLVACAAYLIEQVSIRHFRPVAVIWLVALAFIVPIWINALREMPAGHPRQGQWTTLLTVTGYLISFSILMVWLLIHARLHDVRQRYCLVGLIILLVVSNAIQGLQSVRSSVDDRRAETILTALHKSLNQNPTVESQILITDTSAPPDVEFIVRLAQPNLPIETIPEWNDGIARAAELMSESKRSVLIVDWRTIDGRTTKPLEDKLDIKSQFTPTMIHGRRLATFLLTRRIQPL